MHETRPTPVLTEFGHPVAVGVLRAFLRSGRVLDHAASVLLLAVLLVPVLRPSFWPQAVLPGMAIALALAAKYHAWRVALDAELFAVLLDHPHEAHRFDGALATFLGRTDAPAGKSMQSRWQGARRLLCRQALCLGLQLLVTLLALFA